MIYCPWCGQQSASKSEPCRTCGTDFKPYQSALAATKRSRSRLPSRFKRQLTASGISNIGDGITMGALPLLTLMLTDDSRLIGGTAFASLLPWVLFALPVGVIVDRYDRRRLLILANAVRAVLLGTIAIVTATGAMTIWLLFACLFVLGIGEVLFDSCAQAFLPALVEPEQLERANGLLDLVETVGGRFIGQPLGATLFAAAVGLPFGTDAVTFAVSIALLWSLRVSMPDQQTVAAPQASYRAQIWVGLQQLWQHQLLRALGILLGVVNFATFFGVGIFAKFAVEELHVEQRWYGALLALMASGAVLGGLLGGRAVDRIGRSPLIIMSYLLLGLCPIGTGLSTNFWMVAVFSMVEAFAVTMWNIVTVSLRQRIIPSTHFGRVNGVFRWIGIGSMAIGALVGGQIAHAINVRAPFIVGGVMILLTTIFAAIALTETRIKRGEELPWASAVENSV
jgi:MFS family permease